MNPADASATGGGLKTGPENYVSLATLIDPTKPDVRDLYVSTYGDQGITGFLELTGAKKNAGTSDKVEWYEEGRLHKTITFTGLENSVVTVTSNDPVVVRLNDVLLFSSGVRAVVTDQDTSNATFTVANLDGSALADLDTPNTGTAAIIGNIYGQGTNQPSAFYQTGLKKRENPYIITKEMYEVSGSQATNVGWLNVNGDYRWYLKNEMDARKRFMNQREMMLLYSEVADGALGGVTVGSDDKIVGSQGYFSAVEERGITAQVSGGAQGSFASMSDIDTIILELDKEGAPAEYAMYVNRATSLDIDDMLATGIATQVTAGLAGQFGAFNNDADMAVQLGFKSFTRGGYTFHKHDWKLLNDPTLGGLNNIHKGAMIPLAQVADAKSGVKAPALEMNYKAAGNYSREMEHWVTGGGVLGHNNAANGKDTAIFNYRSECNLVTRAANQHVILK
tara:strand:- start:469 stop:1818 length:1350 start_codon:yes stop_codon:yes gene_type:complete